MHQPRPSAVRIQRIQCIKHDQDLDTTESAEEVCVVSGACAKRACDVSPQSPNKHGEGHTCLIVPAAHHEFDKFITRQGIWLLHHKERCEAPVYGVDAEVGGKVVS